MADNPFDVMCLSETWLNSTWSDTELHIDGYNIIRRDRDDSQRGGGTAINYSTKFTARQRSDLFIQDIETVWLELTLPNRKKTLICALYKPPNADFDAFKASLDNILEQSASEGVETLILGDFNCDMLPNRLPKNSKELMQLLNMYQFDRLIKEPTHITEHSSTTIDLTFTNDAEKIIKSGVLQCSISDHSLIFLTRRAKKLRSPGKNIQYRNFKHYSSENLVTDLNEASWEKVDTSLTVDEAWIAFTETLNATADKHAPLAIKRVRAESLPWLTCEIRKLMRKRDFHHKRAQKQKSTEEWVKYKELRNKTTRFIRNAKQDYYSNSIEKNKKNSSKLWKTLKSVIATKSKTSTIESLETDSGVIQEPKKISQSFAKYFSTAIAKLRQRMTSVLSPPRPRANRSSNNFKLSQVSETFVAQELKKLKSNKSTGLHNIPARLLKDGADALAMPLAIFMNRSINEGSIPASWKHAIETPVHKSGSKSDTSNYRPISVLPVFAKIQEKAVHEMVYSFLLKHKLLSSYQSGFRPLHSTTISLSLVLN